MTVQSVTLGCVCVGLALMLQGCDLMEQVKNAASPCDSLHIDNGDIHRSGKVVCNKGYEYTGEELYCNPKAVLVCAPFGTEDESDGGSDKKEESSDDADKKDDKKEDKKEEKSDDKKEEKSDDKKEDKKDEEKKERRLGEDKMQCQKQEAFQPVSKKKEKSEPTMVEKNSKKADMKSKANRMQEELYKSIADSTKCVKKAEEKSEKKSEKSDDKKSDDKKSDDKKEEKSDDKKEEKSDDKKEEKSDDKKEEKSDDKKEERLWSITGNISVGTFTGPLAFVGCIVSLFVLRAYWTRRSRRPTLRVDEDGILECAE